MAMVNPYASLADLKARLDITGTQDDAVLEQLIEAASRQIDGWCGRVFTAGDSNRRLTADTYDMLILPEDLYEVTAIALDYDGDGVYERTWALTDVDMQPYPGPYQIVRPRNGYAFPTHPYAIQIQGLWGFGGDVPPTIREACLLQAARLYKRKDAPFGIAGSADHGQLQTISRIDPDVNELIKPYIRNMMVV